MAGASGLYDEDFFLWSRQQAEALRAAGRMGSNARLDFENLAEEIESLGASERRELRSRIQRVIRHLLKLQYSRAQEPRRRWVESISDARSEIELVLETSPSLKSELGAIINQETGRGSRRAIADLEEYREVNPKTLARIRATSYAEEQILGDWFPKEPAAR
jgi:Domain of unknown function DUF29